MPSLNPISSTSKPVNPFGEFAAGENPFHGQEFDFAKILKNEVTFARAAEDSSPEDMRSYTEHDKDIFTRVVEDSSPADMQSYTEHDKDIFTRVVEDSSPADMQSYTEPENDTFITKPERPVGTVNLFILGKDLVDRLGEGTMDVVTSRDRPSVDLKYYTLKKVPNKDNIKVINRSPHQYFLRRITNKNTTSVSLVKRKDRAGSIKG